MDELLDSAASRAKRYLREIQDRPVAPSADAIARLAVLSEPFPDGPSEPEQVLALLDEVGSPATMGIAGPRFFGFVIGGALPAALAANWLASAWDQNAAFNSPFPAVSVLESVALEWMCDIFGLPAGTAGAFVTGATMANFSALAAARHAVLAGRLGRRGGGPVRRAADHGRDRRGGAPDARQGARPRRLRAQPPRPRARGRAGPHARRRAAAALAGDDRVRAGGQRQHGRVRSAGRDRRARPRGGRLAARRRRVRPLGRRRAAVAPISPTAWVSPTRGRPTPTSG